MEMAFLPLAKGSLFFCFSHCICLLCLYDKVNIVLHLLTLTKVGKMSPYLKVMWWNRKAWNSVWCHQFGFGNDVSDFSLIQSYLRNRFYML